MINNLSILAQFSLWKYVYASTISETIVKCFQAAAQPIYDWFNENKFQLNGDEKKELIVTFNRSNQDNNFPPIYSYIEENPIKTVTSVELLGMTINSKLS